MNSPAKHVELLDYVRGVAILCVLLFHTLGATYGVDVLPWQGWLRDFSLPASFLCLLPLSLGQAGVAIFFVVSGFCIHMSFQQSGQRWSSFFIRRFFRIYPAYFAALLLSVAIIWTHSGMDFRNVEAHAQLATHLLLIHNFFPLTLTGFNASFWSLAVEAQLYLLYPLLLVGVRKWGWRGTMMLLAGIELAIRGADSFFQTADIPGATGSTVSWIFANSPLGYWFSWALGAWIAEALLTKQPMPFTRIPPLWWLALVVLSYFVKPLYSFLFLFCALTTAASVARLLTRESAPPVAGRGLAALKSLGLWSYSIYLLHQPLLQTFSFVTVWAVPAQYRSGFVPFGLTLAVWLFVIPFAILWYRVFELPGIAWGKRMVQRLSPSPTPANPIVAPLPGSAARNGIPGLAIAGLVIFLIAALVVSAKFSPRAAAENNNRAWTLATSSDLAIRNGMLAVKLAEDACQQTQFKETVMVGTLAAAYAESGQFEKAVATAQQACALAERAGDQKLLQKNQELLDLYLKHQPYHEPKPGAMQAGPDFHF
ncbi:MAG TPA: acyltransferase [Verrucomicrobiae bacterium]